jgi:hypothetical protein
MKTNRFVVLEALSISVISTAAQASAAAQTVDGVVSDAMCVKKHVMPGESDAECTKECVKDGSTHVLVVGDKSYSLKAEAETIAPFAGKHVQVQGDLQQNAISVTAIHDAKGAAHSGMHADEQFVCSSCS